MLRQGCRTGRCNSRTSLSSGSRGRQVRFFRRSRMRSIELEPEIPMISGTASSRRGFFDSGVLERFLEDLGHSRCSLHLALQGPVRLPLSARCGHQRHRCGIFFYGSAFTGSKNGKDLCGYHLSPSASRAQCRRTSSPSKICRSAIWLGIANIRSTQLFVRC
jgi:hypothetical protein